MNRCILFLVVTAIATGCASKRTKYHEYDTSGGYTEQKVDNKLMVASFSGNRFTNPHDAFLFSQFRAVENCREQGFKVAKIYFTANKSSASTVIKSSGTIDHQPFGSSGLVTNSTMWNETYTYPNFSTYFICRNSASRAGIQIKEISASDMKELVKDLFGAVQVMSLADDSPNRNVIQTGDIILKVNGLRIQNSVQFINEIDLAKNENNIQLSLLREGKPLSLKIKVSDVTEQLQNDNETIVANACVVSEIKDRPTCKLSRGASTNN